MGRDAVEACTIMNYPECLEMLLKANCVVPSDGSGIWVCAKNGYLKCLEIHINAGADTTNNHDNGRQALWVAIQNNHMGCIELLLKNGVDLNDMDWFKQTILTDSIVKKKITWIKLLIELGVDVNKCHGHGHTPIMICLENGFIDGLELLIEAGADINKPSDMTRLTPLVESLLLEKMEWVKILIDMGADVNMPSLQVDHIPFNSNMGDRRLLGDIYKDFPKPAILVRRNFNFREIVKRDLSPVMLAIINYPNSNLLKMFIELGAKPQLVSLAQAIYVKCPKMVYLLLHTNIDRKCIPKLLSTDLCTNEITDLLSSKERPIFSLKFKSIQSIHKHKIIIPPKYLPRHLECHFAYQLRKKRALK